MRSPIEEVFDTFPRALQDTLVHECAYRLTDDLHMGDCRDDLDVLEHFPDSGRSGTLLSAVVAATSGDVPRACACRCMLGRFTALGQFGDGLAGRLLLEVVNVLPDVEVATIFELVELERVLTSFRRDLPMIEDHPEILAAVGALVDEVSARADEHLRQHDAEFLDLMITVIGSTSAWSTNQRAAFKILCPAMPAPRAWLTTRKAVAELEDRHRQRLLADGPLDLDAPGSILVPQPSAHGLVVVRSLGRALEHALGTLFARPDGSWLVPASLMLSLPTKVDFGSSLFLPDVPSDEVLDTVVALVRDGTNPEAALQMALDLES